MSWKRLNSQYDQYDVWPELVLTVIEFIVPAQTSPNALVVAATAPATDQLKANCKVAQITVNKKLNFVGQCGVVQCLEKTAGGNIGGL